MNNANAKIVSHLAIQIFIFFVVEINVYDRSQNCPSFRYSTGGKTKLITGGGNFLCYVASGSVEGSRAGSESMPFSRRKVPVNYEMVQYALIVFML